MVSCFHRKIGNGRDKDPTSSAIQGKIELQESTKNHLHGVSSDGPSQVSPARFTFLSCLLASCEAPMSLDCNKLVGGVDSPGHLSLTIRDLRAEIGDGGRGCRPHDLVVQPRWKDAEGHLCTLVIFQLSDYPLLVCLREWILRVLVDRNKANPINLCGQRRDLEEFLKHFQGSPARPEQTRPVWIARDREERDVDELAPGNEGITAGLTLAVDLLERSLFDADHAGQWIRTLPDPLVHRPGSSKARRVRKEHSLEACAIVERNAAEVACELAQVESTSESEAQHISKVPH